VIACLSYSLLILIVVAIIGLFVISKKLLGKKEVAKADLPPSDLLNRFNLPPEDPSDDWNSTI